MRDAAAELERTSAPPSFSRMNSTPAYSRAPYYRSNCVTIVCVARLIPEHRVPHATVARHLAGTGGGAILVKGSGHLSREFEEIASAAREKQLAQGTRLVETGNDDGNEMWQLDCH